MKKIIFFVMLNLLLNSASIYAQVKIEPDKTPFPFDPFTDIVYTAVRNDINQTFSGCQFQWTITNGAFQPSGSTTFLGGSQVTVRWNDVRAGGTLTVQVFDCSPSAILNGTYPQTPYSILPIWCKPRGLHQIGKL